MSGVTGDVAPSQMEKVRATRVYLDSRNMTGEQRRRVELEAFMAIFHPDRELP